MRDSLQTTPSTIEQRTKDGKTAPFRSQAKSLDADSTTVLDSSRVTATSPEAEAAVDALLKDMAAAPVSTIKAPAMSPEESKELMAILNGNKKAILGTDHHQFTNGGQAVKWLEKAYNYIAAERSRQGLGEWPPLDVNGLYGHPTAAATKRLQSLDPEACRFSKHSNPVDGRVGRKTLAMICSMLPAEALSEEVRSKLGIA